MEGAAYVVLGETVAVSWGEPARGRGVSPEGPTRPDEARESRAVYLKKKKKLPPPKGAHRGD